MSKSAAALIGDAEKARAGLTALGRVAAARTAHANEKELLETVTHNVIVEAKEEGLTWSEIGGALGLTPQRVQQLAR